MKLGLASRFAREMQISRLPGPDPSSSKKGWNTVLVKAWRDMIPLAQFDMTGGLTPS